MKNLRLSWVRGHWKILAWSEHMLKLSGGTKTCRTMNMTQSCRIHNKPMRFMITRIVFKDHDVAGGHYIIVPAHFAKIGNVMVWQYYKNIMLFDEFINRSINKRSSGRLILNWLINSSIKRLLIVNGSLLIAQGSWLKAYGSCPIGPARPGPDLGRTPGPRGRAGFLGHEPWPLSH